MSIEFSIEILPSDLVQIVESVFVTMMGIEVGKAGTPWSPAGDRLTAGVHISGDWNGAVLIECETAQACQFAGRFLSLDPPPHAVDDVVRDVVGELANMVGGNLKSLLAPGTRVSSPTVVDGSNYARWNRGAILDRFTFQCFERPFWVAIVGTPT